MKYYKAYFGGYYYRNIWLGSVLTWMPLSSCCYLVTASLSTF